MAGRQRKPTAVLELEGSWRAKTRGREPHPDKGHPPVPEQFTSAHRAIWDRVCHETHSMGVLSVVDGVALERYCRYLLRWRACEEHLAANGLVYPVYSFNANAGFLEMLANGSFIIAWREWPEVKESHKLADELSKLEIQFGLSPAARAKFAPAPLSDTNKGRKSADRETVDPMVRFFSQN